MERRALLLAVVAITACSAASESKSPTLSCVRGDSCGCSIMVSGASCPDGGSHFFHELADGSPLQFNLGQGPASAISAQPQTNIFSHTRGDSWTETYRHNGDTIQIRYSPGANTCLKLGQDEECEYFDVGAKVLISSPRGTQRYSGVGVCGC
jgi:hypothetical protein